VTLTKNAIPLLCSIAMLAPGPVTAQSLTGALVGIVRDAQEQPVHGAVVTLRSQTPAGEQRQTTDEDGRFRFPVLPYGQYALDIEAPRFNPHHEEQIRIAAGRTLERSVLLHVSGVRESVVVSGSGSHIEARHSGFETRFPFEDLKSIPARRFSMFDFVRVAPGVSPTSPGTVSTNSVSVFGSGTNENVFLIDGTNFTCPCSGEARSEPGVDFIQEVHVQSAGASAEFGNLQGAVINVVTRQGSDRFAYDASYYGQTSALTSQPVRLTYPGPGAPESGYRRVQYRDFASTLGGPAIRNRLWFFAGYQYLRDYDSQPGTDPAFPRTYEQDKIFAKLTWRLAPGMQLLQSLHHEAWVNPELATFVKPFETTQRRHATVPAVTFAHLTHTSSPNTVWDVRVGGFRFDRRDDPSTLGSTAPNRFDRSTGVMSGAPPAVGRLLLKRTTAKGALTHVQRRLLGVAHEWKAGAQLEKGEHRFATIIPTGTRYVDDAGRPFQAISRDPSNAGGAFLTAAVFASDTITVSDSLTVNVGVRFDRSRAVSPDLPALDLEGREIETSVRGLGTLYTWNTMSPRLGLTLKLQEDGRTVMRASYGRFHQGVLTGELEPFHPAATPTITTAFDPATGGYTTLVSSVDPRTNLQLDPRIRTPHSDEFSAGVEREFAGGLSLTSAFVHKRGRNFIGWTDVGGRYREDAYPLADGRSIAVLALVNSPAERRFLLLNPSGYALSYNGVVVAAEKRLSHGWQASGSYTLSSTSGLEVSSGATAAGSQVSTIAGAPYLTFGQDPNSVTNARGRLPNDRPHMLRMMGSLEVPRTGFTVAANLQHLSGKPWAASTQVSLPQGDQRILLESRGSRRLSSQTLLDVRVSHAIRLNSSTRIELVADVLNALNDTAADGVATDNLFSSNFGRPTMFVDPRRAMFAVRLSIFGKN